MNISVTDVKPNASVAATHTPISDRFWDDGSVWAEGNWDETTDNSRPTMEVQPSVVPSITVV